MNNHPMMPSASRHGLFLGLAMILFQTILYLVETKSGSALNYLSVFIQSAGLYILIKTYRDQVNEGYLNYGRAVGYGVLVSLFSGIIAAAFIYILYKFIDPSFIDKIILEAEEQIHNTIKDEAQAEKAIEMNQMLITPGLLAMGTVINSLLVGFVISLILGLILKKESVNQFEKDTL